MSAIAQASRDQAATLAEINLAVAAMEVAAAYRDAGDIDAATADLKLDVETGLFEVALALRQADRAEGRQHRRRREEIDDLLELLCSRGLRRPREASDRSRCNHEAAGHLKRGHHNSPVG